MATQQHQQVPMTPPASSLFSGWELRSWFDLRRIRGALLAVLLLRCAIGLIAALTSSAFPVTPLEQALSLAPGTAPTGVWLQRLLVAPWMRYDAAYYELIATHGYELERGTAAFHPLYPSLSAFVSPFIDGNVQLALLLVSTVSTVALLVLFTRYVAEYDAGLAQQAGLLLLLNPFGLILLLPYTESTFLALAVGTLWAAQRERWWLAGGLAALATLTRQQGVALLLPLVWGLFVAVRSKRTPWWTLGAPALIPAAYGLFVVYRAIAVGDLAGSAATSPAELLFRLLVSPSAQTVAEGQRAAWPWVPLLDELRLIATRETRYHLVIDTLGGWVLAVLTLIGMRWMSPQEQLYSLVIVVLSLCYYNGVLSPYMALPRHLLLAFPVFILLARWLHQSRSLPIVLELMLMAQLGLVYLYVRVGWIP